MPLCELCRSREATGTLVNCYHDGTPLDCELVCEVCGTDHDNTNDDTFEWGEDRPCEYLHGVFDTNPVTVYNR